MIIAIGDLLREINILNWYSGEAAKHNDPGAVFVQSDLDEQDAMMYHLGCAVNNVLLLANANRVKFTCMMEDDSLKFELSPLREGREHMKDILKNAIRQYLVYEVRLLWMLTVKPEWVDASLEERYVRNIKDAMSAVTTGNKVRRRATDLAGI